MRILVIDNNIDSDSWGAANMRKFAAAHPGTTVFVRRAPQGDLPKDISSFDRIVVSGSRTSCLDDAPWISRLEQTMRKAIDLGKPLLGVCYGHQVLARVLGGKENVRKGVTPEFGWAEIEVLAENPLFHGISKKFHSFCWHYEELTRVPPGMTLLAKSATCGIQAVQLTGKPIYGIQFHPEKSLQEGESSLEEIRRDKSDRRFLLRPKDGAKLFDSKIGDSIFKNFFSL